MDEIVWIVTMGAIMSVDDYYPASDFPCDYPWFFEYNCNYLIIKIIAPNTLCF